MKKPDKIESKFLVPLYGDKSLGSGRLHPADKWKWLQNELIAKFGGYTSSTSEGLWENPDTGELIEDICREYHVDIKESQLSEMERLLEKVAIEFQQQCIRFVYKGEVYYIPNKELS